jgi:hypothetical protein
MRDSEERNTKKRQHTDNIVLIKKIKPPNPALYGMESVPNHMKARPTNAIIFDLPQDIFHSMRSVKIIDMAILRIKKV